METLYPVLQFLHLMAFVFMSIPLFNLIVVNERAALGAPFNFYTDNYMENIIRHGATRCFMFQGTVLVTGVLLLIVGPLRMEMLWLNWVLLAKMLILFVLMGLLSYVHLRLQPTIDAIVAEVQPDAPVPEGLGARLKPPRVRRKRLATFCLFLVIVTIILGMQVYVRFPGIVTVALIAVAGVFAWRVNKTLVRFGWL